ncbi:MAG: hypothetical protein Q7W13_17680 [Bacteroidia bacterium]|nr:hypothetical protein [Bacteroidia bacterium]
MNANFLQKFRKTETILLGVLLYGIVLVYTYQYFQIANKYEPWTTDEFFYYIEAKAIAAHNIYQTPASLDGNTSYIGDFGFHGISYAIKDGWLSKLLFQTEDPPLVLINFLTCLATLALILLFKPFTLNTRIKIALVVATHYVLFSFTLSYMQETIQYFFAVLALRSLYLIYLQENTSRSNYLWYYLLIIILAITFRYGWFMWGAGLLPLANNFKSFSKWALVAVGLLFLGIFFSRYISAPYPYGELVADTLIRTEKFSLLNSLNIIYQKFSHNLQLFLTPTEILATTIMRYLLLVLLIVNSWYAIVKRNKFTIGCALIGWAYFIACLAFYAVYWGYDERALAVLNPLLAFSLIGNFNSLIFYPVLAIQLWLFPGIVKTTKTRNMESIALNASSSERKSREASYSKIKELITDDHSVVVAIDVAFILHGTTNYFFHFPLINSKGYPIHYRIHLKGIDLRETHPAQYILVTNNETKNNTLIYSDHWIKLYRLF